MNGYGVGFHCNSFDAAPTALEVDTETITNRRVTSLFTTLNPLATSFNADDR